MSPTVTVNDVKSDKLQAFSLLYPHQVAHCMRSQNIIQCLFFCHIYFLLNSYCWQQVASLLVDVLCLRTNITELQKRNTNNDVNDDVNVGLISSLTKIMLYNKEKTSCNT